MHRVYAGPYNSMGMRVVKASRGPIDSRGEASAVHAE